MSSGTDQDSVTKLLKLNTSKNYLHWRCRVYAFIRRGDVELLWISEIAEDPSSAARNKWLEATMKAKMQLSLVSGQDPLHRLLS